MLCCAINKHTLNKAKKFFKNIIFNAIWRKKDDMIGIWRIVSSRSVKAKNETVETNN
jgi:hypothetical protein